MFFLFSLMSFQLAWAANLDQVVRFESAPARAFHFSPRGLFEGRPDQAVGVVETKIVQVEEVPTNTDGVTPLRFVFFATSHFLYVLTADRTFPVAVFPQGVNSFSVSGGMQSNSSAAPRAVTVTSNQNASVVLVRLSDEGILAVSDIASVVPAWRVNLSSSQRQVAAEKHFLQAFLSHWARQTEGQTIGWSWFDPGQMVEAIAWMTLESTRTGLSPAIFSSVLARNSELIMGEGSPRIQITLPRAICSLLASN
jgi:hypothetical protein